MTIGGRDMKIINHKFPVYKNIKKDLTNNSRQAFCYNGLGNNHKIRLKKVGYLCKFKLIGYQWLPVADLNRVSL